MDVHARYTRTVRLVARVRGWPAELMQRTNQNNQYFRTHPAANSRMTLIFGVNDDNVTHSDPERTRARLKRMLCKIADCKSPLRKGICRRLIWSDVNRGARDRQIHKYTNSLSGGRHQGVIVTLSIYSLPRVTPMSHAQTPRWNGR
jgi:hypothetical protein